MSSRILAVFRLCPPMNQFSGKRPVRGVCGAIAVETVEIILGGLIRVARCSFCSDQSRDERCKCASKPGVHTKPPQVIGISARSNAHAFIPSSFVDRYTSVDDLFACPSIDEIVVIGTPFDNILEAAECRRT